MLNCLKLFSCIYHSLKVAFILEKSRLYFRNDSPAIPVFFQLECRAMPAFMRGLKSLKRELGTGTGELTSCSGPGPSPAPLPHCTSEANIVWPRHVEDKNPKYILLHSILIYIYIVACQLP